jgi:hypothetical protein
MKQKRKKVSLNTLANQIFGEHLEWQRYTDRFGTILMSEDAFRLILETLHAPLYYVICKVL